MVHHGRRREEMRAMKMWLVVLTVLVMISCSRSRIPEIRGIFRVYTGPAWQCGEGTINVCFAVQTAFTETKNGIVVFGRTNLTVKGARVSSAADLRSLNGRLVGIRHYNFGGEDNWYSPEVTITLLPENLTFRNRCLMEKDYYTGRVEFIPSQIIEEKKGILTLWVTKPIEDGRESRIYEIGSRTRLTINGKPATQENVKELKGKLVKLRMGDDTFKLWSRKEDLDFFDIVEILVLE